MLDESDGISLVFSWIFMHFHVFSLVLSFKRCETGAKRTPLAPFGHGFGLCPLFLGPELLAAAAARHA